MNDIGATGKFPQGKLNKDDEGELKMALAHHEGKVILNFGKEVVWIAMDPASARGLAELILKHADEAEKQTT